LITIYPGPSPFSRAFCEIVLGDSEQSRSFAQYGWSFSSVPLARDLGCGKDAPKTFPRVPGADVEIGPERVGEVLQFLQESECIGMAIHFADNTYRLLAAFRRQWQRRQFIVIYHVSCAGFPYNLPPCQAARTSRFLTIMWRDIDLLWQHEPA
jgi:hypothetical protein